MTTSISRPILVVGATGPTGIEICKQALAAGMKVRVLVRKPSRLPSELLPRLDVIQGDVLNTEAMVAAISGVEAVVSALGSPLQKKSVTLLSQGTEKMLQATPGKAFLLWCGPFAGQSIRDFRLHPATG